MRHVFIDSWYWIALANKADQWHNVAKVAHARLGNARLVTTDEVLTEFLNHFSAHGAHLRSVATKLTEQILVNSNIEVVHQTRDSFMAGLQLYKERADKQYSLVDCSSIKTMRSKGITEVLTRDDHFAQEGMTVLIRADI